jgi:signal transduction histidine kinase
MRLGEDVRQPRRRYRPAMDRLLVRRPQRRLALAIDVAIVVAVTAITEWNVWAFHTVAGPKWLTTSLPLLLALPLFWRRDRALLAAWLLGIFVHSGRERHALHALAAERDRATQSAIAEERSRLARELHDIVSHNLSVVVLQAGGARAQGDNAPPGTLEKIERSSREALVEMRRLLGVLRENDVDTAAALAPQPGIDQLETVAAGMQAAGLPVELTIDCRHDDLPPALELTVYRIVKEALTNTLKHAGATHAHVRIHRTEQALTIDVVDDGTGNPSLEPPSAGHGLIGMRERVALFGGELTAAARPDGGYTVRATLPLAEPS